MKFKKYKHPLQNLPKHLTEQNNYKKIQRKLIGMLQSTHSHAEIMDWTNCFPCQQRFQKYKEEKRKLGFRSTAEFMRWEKEGHEKTLIKI